MLICDRADVAHLLCVESGLPVLLVRPGATLEVEVYAERVVWVECTAVAGDEWHHASHRYIGWCPDDGPLPQPPRSAREIADGAERARYRLEWTEDYHA